MNIILASSSPRRRMLLNKAGYSFTVIPSDEEERKDYSLSPEEFAKSLAKQKAESVKEKLISSGFDFSGKDGVIIGADTIVVFDGEILGKPKNPEDARLTLGRLSGKKHTVITGFCVIYGAFLNECLVDYDSSDVLFNDLSPSLMEKYVASGLSLDKAGSYGFQDGYDIVKSVSGSESNVIGLPMEKLIGALSETERASADKTPRLD